MARPEPIHFGELQLSGQLQRRWFQPPLRQELALFYRGLATLIDAGIPIMRSVELAGLLTERTDMGVAVNGCARSLNKGAGMAEGMADFPKVFPSQHCSLIKLGEKTGGFAHVVRRLALASERDHDAMQRLKVSLVQPLCLCLASLLFVLGLPALVFPSLLAFFRDLQMQPPLLTRALLAFLGVLASPLSWALAAALTLSLKKLLPRDRVLRLFERLPGLGRVLKLIYVAEISRSLSLMYAAGIPILDALDLAALKHLASLSRALRQARQALIEGNSLSDAFRSTGYFQPFFLHLLAAGEEAGDVSRMLDKAAQFADQSVDDSIEVVTAAFQPVLVAIIGIWVGVLVVAVIGPMIQVASSL